MKSRYRFLALLILPALVWPLRWATAQNETLVCDDIEQRYIVKQSQLQARTLNMLLFDSAERGCLQLLEKFLDLGASVKARDRFGNTALLLAAQAGERRAVQRLLAEGSDIAHRNLRGSTALLRAAMADERSTVKMLLKAGADPHTSNKRGLTPLQAAAYNGNGRMLNALLAEGVDPAAVDATGKGAIVYAAGKGFTKIVDVLLEAGIDPNRRYENDLTALMWAAGHSNDVPAAEGLATMKSLLDRGASLDLADIRGRTALMIAAERGHAEAVAYLLSLGADRALRDRDGKSALDLSASETVRALLQS